MLHQQTNQPVSLIWYKTASDSDTTLLEFWGMWNTPALPLHPGLFWNRGVVLVRISSSGQLEISNYLQYL